MLATTAIMFAIIHHYKELQPFGSVMVACAGAMLQCGATSEMLPNDCQNELHPPQPIGRRCNCRHNGCNIIKKKCTPKIVTLDVASIAATKIPRADDCQNRIVCCALAQHYCKGISLIVGAPGSGCP